MAAPKEILGLVERFERNRESYRSGQYNETQLRREFIDPFFEALGWDVNNKQGRAEAYKDVIHEDAIKIGGATKAPDYCFRIGGTRKFFVEAKKPAVNIKEDANPAFQLRRYAWSAKLPLSILTDFEELSIYDCRIKPAKTDAASTGRVLYSTCDQYAERWDEIASIFSCEAVLKGSFDKYAESSKVKKGTAEVDDAFLKEIETWRDALARNIALRNPKLSQRELNYSVQMTIDRIIFLRICEDRGIESYGRLMALLNGGQVYKRVCELFRQADERYNSGLFHFRKEKDRPEPPDELTLRLTIDDKALKEIIQSLYYPDSPYEFSVLPADILGQVYEQFLGKVIRLTAGHRAVVEDKPEVKKAGGVYYTPTYIVDYIVKHTVGKLCEGKTPKQAAKLKILDPACGSGSFLLGAYQYLLNWHRDWYVVDGAEKWAKGRSPVLYQGSGGDWRLTTAEKKRILLNNIYGVDIDPQAVEVTKLSLLLKVLEGENEQTLERHLKLFHERALPDLSNNIKCGNSLIGSDFYENRQMSLLDEEERYRINVFDWEAEFPKIMKAGGFDAVIGNPPYSNYSARDSMRAFYKRNKLLVELRTLESTIAYCSRAFPEVSEGCKDIYKWFTFKAFQLCKQEGAVGFIIPNTWFTLPKYADLRAVILASGGTITIVDLGFGVFPVTVPTCLLICQRGVGDGKRYYADLKHEAPKPQALSIRVEFQQLTHDGHIPVNPIVSKYLRDWPEDFRLERFVTLREGQHVPREALQEGHRSSHTPVIDSKNIGRYQFHWEPLYSYNSRSSSGMRFQSTRGIRVVVRKTGDRIVSTITPEDESYVLQSLYQSQRVDPHLSAHFVLGLLNSRFLTFVYQQSEFGQKGRTMAQFRKGYLDQLPFPVLNLDKGRDRSRYDRMVELVEQMLTLHKQLAAAKTPDDKTRLQRQIEATDKQIDALVYELYGLTKEEIKMVEESRT